MCRANKNAAQIEAAFKSITLLWNGRALSATPPDSNL